MLYLEFKSASKKHLMSCECLIHLLDNNCEKKEQYILSTMYYLSGYIIETILKFSIYSAIGFKKNLDIKTLKSNGLTYHNNIKIHSLNKLKNEVEKRLISRLINFTENQKLFNNWSSEFRYESKLDYTKKEIISFFKFAKSNYYLLHNYK